jgi:hypothetical protein
MSSIRPSCHGHRCWRLTKSAALSPWNICPKRLLSWRNKMEMLSEDDRNLRDMTDEELAAAWDLWFDLAQATNDFDPPYTHGVLVPIED